MDKFNAEAFFFLENIHADEIVHIYVRCDQGSQSPTFSVPADILANLSQVFATEITASTTRRLRYSGKGAIIRSEDNAESWEVLLYWAFNRELPDDFGKGVQGRRLLDHWLLADKTQVRDLQDAIMLELLRFDGDNNTEYNPSDIDLVFNPLLCGHRTSPQIKCFMAEVAVRAIEVDERMRSGDLRDVWGQEDFTREIVRAYRRFNIYGEEIFERLGKDNVSKAWWKKFMVNGGPKQHWVHERGTAESNEEEGQMSG